MNNTRKTTAASVRQPSPSTSGSGAARNMARRPSSTPLTSPANAKPKNVGLAVYGKSDEEDRPKPKPRTGGRTVNSLRTSDSGRGSGSAGGPTLALARLGTGPVIVQAKSPPNDAPSEKLPPPASSSTPEEFLPARRPVQASSDVTTSSLPLSALLKSPKSVKVEIVDQDGNRRLFTRSMQAEPHHRQQLMQPAIKNQQQGSVVNVRIRPVHTAPTVISLNRPKTDSGLRMSPNGTELDVGSLSRLQTASDPPVNLIESLLASRTNSTINSFTKVRNWTSVHEQLFGIRSSASSTGSSLSEEQRQELLAAIGEDAEADLRNQQSGLPTVVVTVDEHGAITNAVLEDFGETQSAVASHKNDVEQSEKQAVRFAIDEPDDDRVFLVKRIVKRTSSKPSSTRTLSVKEVDFPEEDTTYFEILDFMSAEEASKLTAEMENTGNDEPTLAIGEETTRQDEHQGHEGEITVGQLLALPKPAPRRKVAKSESFGAADYFEEADVVPVRRMGDQRTETRRTSSVGPTFSADAPEDGRRPSGEQAARNLVDVMRMPVNVKIVRRPSGLDAQASGSQLISNDFQEIDSASFESDDFVETVEPRPRSARHSGQSVGLPEIHQLRVQSCPAGDAITRINNEADDDAYTMSFDASTSEVCLVKPGILQRSLKEQHMERVVQRSKIISGTEQSEVGSQVCERGSDAESVETRAGRKGSSGNKGRSSAGGNIGPETGLQIAGEQGIEADSGQPAGAGRQRRSRVVSMRPEEILNQILMLKLKRVGEEDETQEVEELRQQAVLHGDSSSLRDKFLYKISYRTMDVFMPTGREDSPIPGGIRAGAGDDAVDTQPHPAEEEPMHQALFYVTRKLHCVSAVSLGNCTAGYRMRILDRAGRAFLEIHKPCHYAPPCLRKLVPVCIEAQILKVNAHHGSVQDPDQNAASHPTEIIGVIKRQFGFGFTTAFILYDNGGDIVATFKPKRGNQGYKMKLPGNDVSQTGRICVGTDDLDSAGTIINYPGHSVNKTLLLGASVFLTHYQKIGQFSSIWTTCFCNALAL